MSATTTTLARHGRDPALEAPGCLHCAAPVPPDAGLFVDFGDEPRAVCCPGCQIAAETILGTGLGEYYRLRETPAPTVRAGTAADRAAARRYDHPRIQETLVRSLDDGRREVSLALGGIECAACAWLIEGRLAGLPGVVETDVNYATHRARVVWDPERTALSAMIERLAELGYAAHPYDPARREAALDAERRTMLRRVALAGLLGMQVMMIAVALYTGEWFGIDPEFRHLFHWVSLVLTVPVLLYCARPMYAGALRSLRNRHLGMDVPVSLALTLAFAGSVHATVTGLGHVYYDSVTMFVFLLLLARFLELSARRRSAGAAEALIAAGPALATRLGGAEGEALVAVAELEPGDRVLVRPGETVPADGVVVAGRSSVDEALLTGEGRLLPRGPGDPVIGGSVNHESPLTVEVRRVREATVLSRILALTERARGERPALARLADRVASGFIAAVLTLTIAVAVYWWQEDPTRWLPITFAVLAVTCPCALSLANPTAVAAAVGSLLGRGVVLGRGRALEALSRVDTVLIDKTGTLTEGRPMLVEVHPLSCLGAAECRWIAAALERHSEHPLAVALAGRPGDAPLPIAHAVENLPGGGLRGEVGGRRYVIGSPAHVQRELGHQAMPAPEGLVAAGDTLVVLADTQAPRCLFVLRDRLRPDAADTVAGLRAAGLEVILASGDRSEAVAEVAARVGIRKHAGALDPQGKLAWLGRLRAEGRRVCMVGDGVNDAPVLAAADASVAMGRGAPAAQGSADAILLGDRLGELAPLIREARRTRRIIAQNLTWAALYNFSALPAAAAGLIAPWMAAVGMAASSLLVVANSLRLARGAPDARPPPGSPRSTASAAAGGGNPPAASGAV